MTRIAITGATGRMGRTLVQLVHEADDLTLTGATDRPDSALLGQDIGALCGLGQVDVPVVDSLAKVEQADVVIDFTLPSALESHLTLCRQKGFSLVIGTTGLSADQKSAIAEAGQHIPLVFAPNMSVGVTVLTQLIEKAAAILGDDYDVEIVEMHHRHKVDAPSGTALALGEAAARGLGRNLEECAIYGREGAEGPRDRNTIGFATLRGGDVVGDHNVIFAADGERIEIGHKASSRLTFARGALRAARWLGNQSAGLYTMRNVLGL
ncbi:MAG: 4-hydroxy-tetrahydrodipicolinate reductase [Natronospirillum sp.]|uniref:4-hydroxy-tetrahydrodipicolinate reductase n=1 Tax=Natronospirillum sp. TaxID=2812955 RepID=UPI0025D9FC2B|nr:4-hydroxy-tetrahydrodipicolinate reductase [Natronospirillum sp.]MCH8551836.1 4-hydroxy-tetrahydrodipicolinate reductase [Natronospirillum sp.]